MPFIVSLLCHHPKYKWAQCFDLKNNPEDYINLTPESLEHFMSKSPKIIRNLRSNKSPIIMNSDHISKINEYKHISEKELLRRADIISANINFKQTVEKNSRKKSFGKRRLYITRRYKL